MPSRERHWATHDVRWHTTGTKQFHHRVAGDLELDYEALELAADPGHTLVTFTAPADSPAAAALAFLTSWTSPADSRSPGRTSAAAEARATPPPT